MTPNSTYRVQFTGAFTFQDAAGVVEYLAALGVDWLYASPILTVPEGAEHGYHVTDVEQVNPELGGDAGLAVLRAALEEHGLGLVLDIVPNHMAATTANAWFVDVLRHGARSRHARVFDIDFEAGPIVLPWLGAPLAEELAAGHIERVGTVLRAGDVELPLAPGTPDDAPLAEVLAHQHYELAFWREGEERLNWRRFFAINELVGVRVEDPAVFDAVNGRTLELVADGTVAGLRVDHIDGLRDPTGFLEALRDRVGAGTWLVVEKILESGEELPASWPVAGTTGYEVAASLQGWLLDPAGYAELRAAFAQATAGDGLADSATAELPLSKAHVLEELFVAEVDRLVRLLAGREDAPPVPELRPALVALTACFSVYRTYASSDGTLAGTDAARIAAAADQASSWPGVVERAVRWLREAFLHAPGNPDTVEALLRWQQLTGPAMAKGFEDRLLYRQVALSGVCEVGTDAAWLDDPPGGDEAVVLLAERARSWPAAGSTTATHDTKRGEDLRARLAVLSEDAGAFLTLFQSVSRWLDRPDVDGHARWLVLQTVVGVLELEPGSEDASLAERLASYTRKALREAEVHTSHRRPDTAYEERVLTWLRRLLAGGRARRAVDAYVERIALPGAVNALAQVVAKLAAPGVPDVYQGTELWDSSLVDPDNRRPVDFALRRELLEGLADAEPAALLEGWRDGRVKLLVTTRALHARRRHHELMLGGTCARPQVRGAAAQHVAALLRRGDTPTPAVVAAAARLPLTLAGSAWPVGDVWADTTLTLPAGAAAARDALTGRDVAVEGGTVRLAEVFAQLPVAWLEVD